MVPNLGLFVRLWRRVQGAAHGIVTAARNLFIGEPVVGPLGFDLDHPAIAAQLAQIARYQRLSQINTESLPPEERRYGHIVSVQLGHLDKHASAFADAVELFDRSQGTTIDNMELRFMHMACRDGTFSLWNFATALNAIKASLDNAPTLRDRMRVGDVDQAISNFWQALPHAKALRDSVGHVSEMMRSPSEWDRHSLKDGHVNSQINIGSNSFWVGNIMGRKYSTTAHGGKLVEYEVSNATVAILNAIRDQVYAAILPPPPRPAPPA